MALYKITSAACLGPVTCLCQSRVDLDSTLVTLDITISQQISSGTSVLLPMIYMNCILSKVFSQNSGLYNLNLMFISCDLRCFFVSLLFVLLFTFLVTSQPTQVTQIVLEHLDLVFKYNMIIIKVFKPVMLGLIKQKNIYIQNRHGSFRTLNT